MSIALVTGLKQMLVDKRFTLPVPDKGQQAALVRTLCETYDLPLRGDGLTVLKLLHDNGKLSPGAFGSLEHFVHRGASESFQVNRGTVQDAARLALLAFAQVRPGEIAGIAPESGALALAALELPIVIELQKNHPK